MWEVKSRYEEPDFYPLLERELNSLVEGEKNLIANLSNISSWINHSMSDLNWCGFYLWDEADSELILGPFQGKPACIRIKSGKGVCGTSFETGKAIKVDNVNLFPGHIACDSASLSELVIPLFSKGKCKGVLDLDSPLISRFTDEDQEKLTQIMNRLAEKIF